MRLAPAVLTTLLLAIISVGATTLASEPIVRTGQIEEVTGVQYKAIEMAIRAVESEFGQSLDANEYQFLLIGHGDSIEVGIVDIRNKNTFGVTGRVPEYSVRLTPDGTKVLNVRLVDD